LATNIAGNFFLVPRLGLEGIAISALVATIVSTIFLCISTRKSYGTSLLLSAILLFGWCLWIGFAWAIDLKNNLALAGVVFGVFVLAAVHWFSWKTNLHHGSV
jgi:peptidoglycan biosynthesis protein MviN/MurJ (putative lipid II flippase)